MPEHFWGGLALAIFILLFLVIFPNAFRYMESMRKKENAGKTLYDFMPDIYLAVSEAVREYNENAKLSYQYALGAPQIAITPRNSTEPTGILVGFGNAPGVCVVNGWWSWGIENAVEKAVAGIYNNNLVQFKDGSTAKIKTSVTFELQTLSPEAREYIVSTLEPLIRSRLHLPISCEIAFEFYQESHSLTLPY